MENKTSKYFKYAIGEIVLVVIGILIALQINNWNENRKNQNQAQTLIKNLYDDIKNDTLQLNKHIKHTLVQLNSIDTIAALLVKSQKTDINRFIKLQENLHNFSLFEPNQSTYEEALSTGKFAFLDSEDLRKDILSYYRDINGNNNDKVMTKLRDERILPFINDHIYNTKEVASIIFRTDNKLPSLDLIKLSKNKDYFGILVTSKGKQFQISNWKSYIEKAKKILNTLETEIKLTN